MKLVFMKCSLGENDGKKALKLFRFEHLQASSIVFIRFNDRKYLAAFYLLHSSVAMAI